MSRVLLSLLPVVCAFYHVNCQNITWKDCDSKNPRKSIHIHNEYKYGLHIDEVLDDFLFTSEEDLIRTIRELKAPGFSQDYQKAWYFMCQFTWSANKPIDERSRYNDALVFLNTLGFGFCGSKSEALASIWNKMGYKTRVWDLQGHIVPEIYVNGEWQVWDPTYHVFYGCNQCDVILCGVKELTENPSLVDHPWFSRSTIRLPQGYRITRWMKRMGYGKELAAIYGSAGDNKILLESEPTVPSAVEDNYVIPGGSDVIVPVFSGLPLYSNYHNKITRLYHYAELAVYVPAGKLGTIDLPLMLHGISATSLKYTRGTKNFVLNGKKTVHYGSGFTDPEPIIISENDAGAWFYFLVNPRLFESLKNSNISDSAFVNFGIERPWVKPAAKNRVNVLYLSDIQGKVKTEKLFKALIRRIFAKRYAYVPQ
jgi:hypothetical protein